MSVSGFQSRMFLATLLIASTAVTANTNTAEQLPEYTDSSQGSNYEDGDGPHPYYSDQDDHHGSVAGVCLQAFQTDTLLGVTTVKFRCCEPDDAPDVCTQRSSYHTGHKKDWKRDDSSLFIGTVISPDTAAICEYEAVEGGCPNLGFACQAYAINCTINNHAKCAEPLKNIPSLQATLYAVYPEALTCNQSPELRRTEAQKPSTKQQRGGMAVAAYNPDYTGPANVTAYVVTADRLQGAFKTEYTSYGYMERKGTVEYIQALTSSGWPLNGTVTSPLPDLPFVRQGQMIIRVWQEDYGKH